MTITREQVVQLLNDKALGIAFDEFVRRLLAEPRATIEAVAATERFRHEPDAANVIARFLEFESLDDLERQINLLRRTMSTIVGHDIMETFGDN